MRSLLAVITCVGAIVCSGPARTASPPPASAFVSKSAMGSVVLSPDGARIAWVSTGADGKDRLAISNLSDNSGGRFNAGDNTIGGAFFEDGGRVIVSLGNTTRISGFEGVFSYQRYVSIDPQTGEALPLLVRNAASPGAASSGADIVSLLADEPDAVVAATYTGDGYSLYKAFLTNSMTRLVASGTAETLDWAVDVDGDPLARLNYNAVARVERLQVRKGDNWTDAVVNRDVDAHSMTLFGATIDGAVLFSRRGADFESVERLNPATGEISVFARPDGVEISSVVRNVWTSDIVGLRYAGAEPGTQWIDPRFAELETDFVRKLGGGSVLIVSYSRDLSKAIGWQSRADRAPRWLLYDRTSSSVRVLGALYPGLDGVLLGRTRNFDVDRRNGGAFATYVTRPPGAPATGAMPTVVIPPSAFGSQSTIRFEATRQFLATRGYVVIEPQIRGVGGFGERHLEAGKGQIGSGMRDDIADTIAWAVRTGLSDPKRICIVGFNWGGYQAAAGAAFSPDLYACAASINGIVDLSAVAAEAARNERNLISTNPRSMRVWLGSDSGRALEAISPAYHVDQVRVPLLLMQVQKDNEQEFARARRMAETAQRSRKPVEFVALPDEDDWAKTYEQLEAFLARHLKP